MNCCPCTHYHALSSIIFYRIKHDLLHFAESTGNKCEQWRLLTDKCLGGDEANADACCKEQTVPYECAGLCLPESSACVKWYQQVSKCRVVNEAKACCKDQGVPDECSAYCESA